MKKVARTKQTLKKSHNHKKLYFWVKVVTLMLVGLLLIFKRTFWTPDTLFIILLGISIIFGHARSFIIRFSPLVGLLLLYEVFRGFADDLNRTVHFTEMIDVDRWLFFGNLPTVVLQKWWWDGTLRWYDFYFYFLYTLHFLMPFLLAVLIWRKAPTYYWRFVIAILLLSFAAFITYVLFPAAPPWMAKDVGIIVEPLHRISSDIWAAMGIQNFSEVYSRMPANPVAAVPSLHSAYPLLTALFITGIFGYKKYWWVYVYPLSIWIGVVYIGEHYVIDVILGALYAFASYFIVMHCITDQKK